MQYYQERSSIYEIRFYLLEWWKADDAAKAAAASEFVSDEDPLGFSLVVVEQLPSFDLLNLLKNTSHIFSLCMGSH